MVSLHDPSTIRLDSPEIAMVRKANSLMWRHEKAEITVAGHTLLISMCQRGSSGVTSSPCT